MAIGTTVRLGYDGSEVQRGFAGLKKSLSNIGSGMAKMIGGVAALGAGAVAGVAGIGALAFKINGIGEEATASNDRLKNIVKQMGLFGNSADNVSDRLLDFADAQGRLLGIDDDVIAGTQAKLATFKELASTADVVGGSFDRATIAALDMAAAGFGSAETNAVQLGKALNDPIKGITALTRSGITFTASEKQLIATLVQSGQQLKAQDIILKAIETQVGGTAQATAKASDKIQVTFGQLAEGFAVKFSEGFAKLPAMLESVFVPLLAKVTEIGNYFGQAIGEAVAGDSSKFQAIGDYIGTAVSVGMKSSFSAGYNDMVKGLFEVLENINPIRRGLEAVGIDASRQSQRKTPSFSEILDSNAINAGLEAKGQVITGQTPQAYQPSMHSPAFKNAQQEAMLEELKKQNALLLRMSQTSKM